MPYHLGFDNSVSKHIRFSPELLPPILAAIWLSGISFSFSIFPLVGVNAALGMFFLLVWIIPFIRPWDVQQIFELRIFANPLTSLALLVFFVYSFIGGIFSVSPGISLSYWVVTVLGFFICAKLWFFLGKNYILFFKLFCLFTTLGFCFFHFLQGTLMSSRNPNAVGTVLISVVACCYLFKYLPLRFILTTITLSLLFSTHSRNSTIATIIVLLIQVMFDSIKANKTKLVGFILLFSLTLLMIFDVLPMSMQSMSLIISDYLELDNHYTGLESGFTGRTDVWNVIIQIYLKSDIFDKLFGIGYRVHETYLDYTRASFHISSSHNGYLAILLEMGLVGSLSIFSMIFYSFNNLLQRSLMQSRVAVFGLSLYLGYFQACFFERVLINFGNPTSIIVIMFIMIPRNIETQ